MNNNDLLKIYRGGDYSVTDYIKIKQPTIGQIADYGEKEYFSMISSFIMTPFDVIAQLDKIGIDFTTITSYQLFCLTVNGLKKESTSILFGDVDFSKYKVSEDNGNIVLKYENSIISEPVYNLLSNRIRKMHNLSDPKYQRVGNELTKQKMIEYAYDDLRATSRKKYKSRLLSLVSSLVNHPDFKYGYFEIWNMPIFAFYDSIKRINVIENTRNLYQGVYAGTVDASKINKKEFDWMRNLS